MPAPPVPAALADLAKTFRGLRVRWYVFGAQALIAAGVPRLTADIDVTVEVPRGGPRALVDALLEGGFVLRDVGDVERFVAETRVVPAPVARRRVATLAALLEDETLIPTFDRIARPARRPGKKRR